MLAIFVSDEMGQMTKYGDMAKIANNKMALRLAKWLNLIDEYKKCSKLELKLFKKDHFGGRKCVFSFVLKLNW